MTKAVFPSRAIALLVAIGFLDLVMTAVLHANGLIVEMNPLMRVLIERSEVLFAVVKSATIVFAWIALALYAQTNYQFVRKAALTGSIVYVTIWVTWFLVGRP
ncbi:MAG: hypothetical protein JSS66_02470 [Armatimonadetes bacterium]|nr:hypothetical protein [Armatimonadota bacterium]